MSGRYFLGVLLLLSLSCGAASAQATGQISGTVTDQTGALIPGAEITAAQTDMPLPVGLGHLLTRAIVSNETGAYVFPNLPTGPYTLEVTLPGFRTYRQTGIVLQSMTTP